MILTAFSISEENFRRMGSPESCCFGGCQAEAAPGWSHREPVFLEERWSRLEAGQGGCRPAEPWACQAHGGRMPRRAVPLPQLSDTMGVTDTANSCPELCREAACLHCLQLSYSTYLLLQSFKMYVTVVRCDVHVTYEGARVSAWSAFHCCGANQGSDGYTRNCLHRNVQQQLGEKFSGTIDFLYKLEIFSLALEGYLGKDSLGRMDETAMCWACTSFQWPHGYCCSGLSAQGRSLDPSWRRDGVLQPHSTMKHLA